MQQLLIDIPRPASCPLSISTLALVHAIREQQYPGLYPELPNPVLQWGECYFNTDVWHQLYRLGPQHAHPFYEIPNSPGVIYTWLSSPFVSTQMNSIG